MGCYPHYPMAGGGRQLRSPAGRAGWTDLIRPLSAGGGGLAVFAQEEAVEIPQVGIPHVPCDALDRQGGGAQPFPGLLQADVLQQALVGQTGAAADEAIEIVLLVVEFPAEVGQGDGGVVLL